MVIWGFEFRIAETSRQNRTEECGLTTEFKISDGLGVGRGMVYPVPQIALYVSAEMTP